MGILNWWSRVRTEIHTLEPESGTASRLGRTPPEFWTPRDWSESRRLRHCRRLFIEEQMERGRTELQAQLLADEKFPRGPFWPVTPQRDTRLRRDWFRERTRLAILKYVGLGPNQRHLLHYWIDRNGIVWGMNRLTGRVYNLTHFGMW